MSTPLTFILPLWNALFVHLRLLPSQCDFHGNLWWSYDAVRRDVEHNSIFSIQFHVN